MEPFASIERMFDTGGVSVLRSFDPFPPDDFGVDPSTFDGFDGADGAGESGSSRRTEQLAVVEPQRPDLAEIIERIRPTVLSVEQTLPVPDALGELFPLGGIARGSRLSLRGNGATSLCLASLTTASREGSWIAVVGAAAWGWAAAARFGWSLERCVFVEAPPESQWGTVMAALVDALDVVVADPGHQVGATDARRLSARARERGSVVVDLALDGGFGGGRRRSRWPSEADLTLTAETTRWDGLDHGAGRLGERTIRVETTGRRGAARPRRFEVSIAADGTVAVGTVGYGTVGAESSGIDTAGATTRVPERRHLRAV